ncbi:glycosyltransferase [Pontibacter ruber]|uniref:Glycosyltransferase n=1 Tax=Pontibacter ruber TaxID=1343895 RepID=A0ABW5D0Z6_9BACT|nr:glycosyltransferase [Pontibacter ruber]
MSNNNTRILFFIGSLRGGGKERRLLELLSYLKKKGCFDMMVVVTRDEVHYVDFFKLNIPYTVIKREKTGSNIDVFYEFYKICKAFQPHVVHTWGRMQSFYTLPAVITQKIPVINSQITGAPTNSSKWSVYNLIDYLNFRFSKVILSNSKAGLDAYNPPIDKCKVIYNGMSMSRFCNLPDAEVVKGKYGITTPYVVVMAATFSHYKNYDLFYKIADFVTGLRDDVTFIGVGGYEDATLYNRMKELSSKHTRISFPGRINDVEALVNACTIGVLFSTNGEGISNAILEYMALAKPVIASAPGGTKEIVHHHENGYLVTNESEEEIAYLILDLIDDKEKRESFGRVSRRIIEDSFSIEKMGQAFEQVYESVLTNEMKVKVKSGAIATLS